MRPACARCAYEASTRPARRISLAAFFLCFSFGGGFWASRRYDFIAQALELLIFGGVVAVVIAVCIAHSGKRNLPAVENRDPDDEVSSEVIFTGNPSPYRARV